MDIMAALADPVRRTILETLRARPLTAGEIANRFAISRPAVSRHLRILREAGLVSMTQSGRTRIYRLDSTPLAELDAWLAQYRNLWSTRFDALETEVYRTRRERERREQPNPGERMSSTEPHDPPEHNEVKELSA
jgi:DNA-binding transcriptional ArsR family regulator